LDRHPLPDHEAEIWSRWELGFIVLRDHAAHRYARERIEQIEHRGLNGAADVLEIGVDAVGAGHRQFTPKIERAVIDAVVEAQAVLHVEAFLRPTGDTDHARAGTLGQLSRDRTDRA